MKLITALRAEMLKTKRTASFYFTLAGAAPVPLIFLINVLTNGGDLQEARKDPLNRIFEMGTERAGIAFFPMFVILVCTLLAQIEYRNNTWKQVLAAPQSKAHIFLAKFLNINGLVLLFLAATLFYLSVLVLATHLLHPELHLLQQPFDAGRLLARTAYTYLTILAMCTIQFWLGLRFRNFVIPTALGFALWITGMMLAFEFKSGLAHYFPYSIQTYPFVPTHPGELAQVAGTSVGYALLFLTLGFLDFRRRRMTA